MRILYYDWDEFNGEDCRDAMTRLGHYVDVMKANMVNGKTAPGLKTALRERLSRAEDGIRFYDAVFSFDYFPEISEACQELNFPYISWVFDCPHYPLYSNTIFNDCNQINVFDRKLCQELTGKGAKNIIHTPLAINRERLADMGLAWTDNGQDHNYIHEVAFLGNLYDNEFNFYDQANIPGDLKSYLEDVIFAQQSIFGEDILTDKRVISEDIMEELKEYIEFEDTGLYDLDYDRVILDIIRKKITVSERRRILEELGKRFDTVVYTTSDAEPIPGVPNMGVADYMNSMPYIFHNTKVNINITMRCIHSGVSLRVMDVLAAGGFLVTTSTAEIEEYFTDGVDLAIAHTPEEMLEKTAYYLEHDSERRKIALNGQKKVFENFAYTKLLPGILKISQ